MLSRAFLNESENEADKELEKHTKVAIHSLMHESQISYKQLETIRHATLLDPTLCEVKKISQDDNDISKFSPEERKYKPTASEIYDSDGIVVYEDRIIIPTDLRQQMLSWVYEGHLGIDKCKRMAREVMYWPGMSTDIEYLINKCNKCNTYRRAQPPEPLLSHEVPTRPWQKLAADILHSMVRIIYLLWITTVNF